MARWELRWHAETHSTWRGRRARLKDREGDAGCEAVYRPDRWQVCGAAMGRHMEPNDVIGDRYELGEPIGRGGMATIFRATDLRMGRMVAVKVLREVYSSDPKFVTRFQREARAASALQHPNIVQVFDYGQSGESYYIVMEYVEGADLRRYLKRQ